MKGFACEQCGKSFKKEASLEQHFGAKHLNSNSGAPRNVSGTAHNAGSSLNSGTVFAATIIGALVLFGFFALNFSGPGGNDPYNPPSAPENSSDSGLRYGTQGRTGNAVGDRAPDFVVSTTEGETIRLSDIRNEGKPVVVEFVATWCPHCNRDLTTLKGVYPEYSDRVEFLAVGLDQREGASLLANWKQENGFPVKLAPAPTSMLRDYAVTYTTTRYAISPDGIITHKSTGSQSASWWKNTFDSLI